MDVDEKIWRRVYDERVRNNKEGRAFKKENKQVKNMKWANKESKKKINNENNNNESISTASEVPRNNNNTHKTQINNNN